MTIKSKLKNLYADFKIGDPSEEETPVPRGFKQKVVDYSFEVGTGNREEEDDRIAAVILHDQRVDADGKNIQNFAFFFRGDKLNFPRPILKDDGGVVFFGYESQLGYFLATLESGRSVTLSGGPENMHISVQRKQ